MPLLVSPEYMFMHFVFVFVFVFVFCTFVLLYFCFQKIFCWFSFGNSANLQLLVHLENMLLMHSVFVFFVFSLCILYFCFPKLGKWYIHYIDWCILLFCQYLYRYLYLHLFLYLYFYLYEYFVLLFSEAFCQLLFGKGANLPLSILATCDN